MHVEALLLDLMATENTQQSILSHQLLHWLLAKVVGAVAFRVLFEVTVHGFIIIHWVCPHQITEDAIKRNLLLPINLVNLLQLF